MPPQSREALWSTGRDETVEVNQRALIDKILARYSGEHTIFRELLQNADDAGAEHVQVKFYSRVGIDALERGDKPSTLPNVKKDPIYRYVVTNDGIPFRGEDWQRLKKIAEGNPDEEKIGAFGVGFYSLWSVCDDPFVESGDKWMGFYWKDGKDQLLARSGDLPPVSAASTPEATLTGHPWTTFTMALRSPTPLEGPLDFARFLVTSLTFMRTIKRIDMVVDDIKVLEVRKDVKGKQRVSKSGLRETSTAGMMKVQSVDATGMVITARVMKWLSASGFTPTLLPPPVPGNKPKGFSLFGSSFFNRLPTPAATPPPPALPPPPPENPTEVTVLAREIRIFEADVKVTVSPAFGRELERATKKSPPARMPASLVFNRGEEGEVTKDYGTGGALPGVIEASANAVFAGLCPPMDSETSAKIFIGQATGQTTGIGGHLAARFIPTVERESIDLVDRHVSHWNKELLWVGGYLARLIYELELVELQQLWAATTVSDHVTRARLLSRGLHALRFFSFKTTTPSPAVGHEMESAFLQCATNNTTFPLISTAGILPVNQVRMPSAELQKFLPDLPVLTPATVAEMPRSVARLRERSLLRDVMFDDVIKALGTRPLTEKEMINCLVWWQAMAGMEGYGSNVRDRLIDAAILVTDTGKIVPLSLIQTFVKPQASSIPTDMPLPPHTLPYAITKDLKGAQIYQVFGWTELNLLQYITFLLQPPMSDTDRADPLTDLRVSPAFAERVLGMLGRAWQSISANQQSAIALELRDVACVPTRAGFKLPREAYFEKNLLFDDLPTIALPKTPQIKGGMEKMLLAIGVRRTVDLQLVFSRLVGGGEWTCLDLMKYLVSVKDTLSTDELGKLKQTAAFPLEQPPLEDGTLLPVARRKPSQLYEPIESMRSLGLPVLDWGEAKWKSNSDEAKMLFSLGLRRYPAIDVLLGIASGRAPMNDRALAFLLTHMSSHYINFEPAAFSAVPFIPATSAAGVPILAKPGEAYINSACSILGFSVCRPPVSAPENAARLRVASDPPMDRLVAALLANPTSDPIKARSIFEYLSTRLGASQVSSLAPLAQRKFIPVQDGGSDATVRLARPDEVYFTPSTGDKALYASAFTFVDFGERANLFLRQCGVKSEPSHKDIARLLIREPDRMLRQAGSPDKYLDQLRLLAANMSTFDSKLVAEMRSTAFLLASQRVQVKRSGKKATVGGDDDYEREWVLCKATDIVLVDNITMLQFFGTYVLAAPEEHLLEKFYTTLGSRMLSTRVQTETIPHGVYPGSSANAAATRRHVLERLTIFLATARRKESDYSVDWLSKGDNFVVSEASDLKVRYTYRYGKVTQQHSETLYATANLVPRSKAIVLTISLTAQPDDYDIAAALCLLLMKQPKADDALLLYSILSTPLMALKKRGYNVDRILNQHREERMRVRAEEARDRELAAAAATATLPETEALSDNMADSKSLQGGPPSGVSPASPKKKDRTPSVDLSIRGSIMDMVRKLGKDRGDVLSGPGAADQSTSMTAAPDGPPPTPTMPGGFGGLTGWAGRGGGGGGGGGSGGGGGGAGGEHTTARPTDLDNIRNVVHKAVSASRPETATEMSESKRAVKDVSESQESYCDESASAALKMVIDPGPQGCKIWLSNDDPVFSGDQRAICERFARDILIPIGEIFQLSPAVINVFWDRAGPLIAFNRNGTIFCNARYYSAWHDSAVQKGQRANPLTSWYFSIAHELAHNLEAAHNSSHEFYFSSIAEEYLERFTRLLAA